MKRRLATACLLLAALPVGAESLAGRLDWVAPLELSTPRSGLVREVLVASGDRVAGGAPLARLEMRDARAHLAAAQAALNATRAAVQEGIVVGGGVALVQGAKHLEGVEGANPDQNAGIAIVRRALEAPLRQIAENAGVDGSIVLQKVRDGEGAFGYNALTGVFEDLVEAGGKVKEGASKEEAETIKGKLEAAGATVELK